MPQRILVLGAGFAGLWSALGAARELARRGVGPERAEVVVVNRDAWHSIRVRNYEANLSGIRVPLASVFDPAGIRLIEGDVFEIIPNEHRVGVPKAGTEIWLDYDCLVFALGSVLVHPNVPGLAEHAFDVDTFAAASRLEAHLAALPERPQESGQFSVAVLGAGLTGIERAESGSPRPPS